MNDDEKRGYARGYAAGTRKHAADRTREHLRRERQAFWDRAFLASLGVCVGVDGWKCGDKPITTLPDRVALASDVADEAAKIRRCVS